MKYFVMINHPSKGIVVPLNNDKGVALFTIIEKAHKKASKSCVAKKYGFGIYRVLSTPINKNEYYESES